MRGHSTTYSHAATAPRGADYTMEQPEEELNPHTTQVLASVMATQLDDDGEATMPETFQLPRVRVREDRRIAIPASERKHFDIGEDDVVHLVVDTGDETFVIGDAVVGTGGRITIPAHKFDIYGLSGGQVVDVEVVPTIYRYEE